MVIGNVEGTFSVLQYINFSIIYTRALLLFEFNFYHSQAFGKVNLENDSFDIKNDKKVFERFF